MKLYHMFTGDLGVNTYFLVNENDRAAVVDPGEDGAAVLAFAEKHGFKITACYLTHGHFDHMGCCKRLQDLGVKIYVSEKDADKLYTDKNEGAVFGRRVEPLHADNTFRDGDVLDFEGFKLRVMETPGHTAGSVCFLPNSAYSAATRCFMKTRAGPTSPTATTPIWSVRSQSSWR